MSNKAIIRASLILSAGQWLLVIGRREIILGRVGEAVGMSRGIYNTASGTRAVFEGLTEQ
jgi:hypothetical protein